MEDSIDKTIERIEEDIKENGYSLPKVAPTQHDMQTLSLMLTDASEYAEQEIVTLRVEAHCRDCDWELPTETIRIIDPSMEPLPMQCAESHGEEYGHDVEFSAIGDRGHRTYLLKGKPESRSERFWKKLAKEIPMLIVGVVLGVVGAVALQVFWEIQAWYINWSCGSIGYWGVLTGRALWHKVKEK